jgi:hypothetical protein
MDVKYMRYIVFVCKKHKNRSVLLTLPSDGENALGKVTICPSQLWRVPLGRALGKEFTKKIISLSSVAWEGTRQIISKKNNFFAECRLGEHSAKNFQKQIFVECLLKGHSVKNLQIKKKFILLSTKNFPKGNFISLPSASRRTLSKKIKLPRAK